MNSDFIKREWIFWIILLIPFAYLLFIWNSLPATVPVHWNLSGQVDKYGTKEWESFYLPVLNVLTYLLLLVLPKIDPRKKNYEDFAFSYKRVRFVVVVFFALLYIFSMQTALGNSAVGLKVGPMTVYLAIALLGNYMRTVRPNWFIGFRTPWTLESPEVWKRTHELGGKLFFYSGIIGALLMLVVEFKYGWIGAALIIASALYIIIYSFIEFKKLEKEAKEINE